MGVRNIFIERQLGSLQRKMIQYAKIKLVEDRRDGKYIYYKHFLISSWIDGESYWYSNSLNGVVNEEYFYTLYRKPYSNEILWLILNITGQK
jgi:hypothetical protein